MPMIDVYASEGKFADKHHLAKDLANAVIRCEQVPDLALVGSIDSRRRLRPLEAMTFAPSNRSGLR